jgi:hypothetical protein
LRDPYTGAIRDKRGASTAIPKNGSSAGAADKSAGDEATVSNVAATKAIRTIAGTMAGFCRPHGAARERRVGRRNVFQLCRKEQTVVGIPRFMASLYACSLDVPNAGAGCMPLTGNGTGAAGGRRYRPLKLQAESTLSVGSNVSQDVQRDRARMPDRPASRNGASHVEP